MNIPTESGDTHIIKPADDATDTTKYRRSVILGLNEMARIAHEQEQEAEAAKINGEETSLDIGIKKIKNKVGKVCRTIIRKSPNRH